MVLLALKGDTLPAATQRNLEIALRQSVYLATLIDELFELAKLDFKGLQLERETFQFAEVAVDVLQRFQLAADAKHVRLRVDAQASAAASMRPSCRSSPTASTAPTRAAAASAAAPGSAWRLQGAGGGGAP